MHSKAAHLTAKIFGKGKRLYRSSFVFQGNARYSRATQSNAVPGKATQSNATSRKVCQVALAYRETGLYFKEF